MRVGEIWKAKPRHKTRFKYDMIELLESIPEEDSWEVRFFLADETPEAEKIEYGYMYDIGNLERKEILDQFYKVR